MSGWTANQDNECRLQLAGVRQYMGSSIGYWEGDTLVELADESPRSPVTLPRRWSKPTNSA